MKLSELFTGLYRDWHGYDAPAGTRLIDGSVTVERERLWRRRVADQWEFKRMTEDDEALEIERHLW